MSDSNIPTNEEQCDLNVAEVLKAIIGAVQQGLITPANSARLQNLTIDDLMGLVDEKISKISLGSHIIPPSDETGGNTVNVIDYTRSFDLWKDIAIKTEEFTPFVSSTDTFRINLHNDLNDPKKIMAVYAEEDWLLSDNNKGAETPKNVNSFPIQEWNYGIDSSSSSAQQYIDFPKHKYKFDGVNGTEDNTTGEYWKNKKIFVTYIYDKTYSGPRSPDPIKPIPLPPDSVIANIVDSEPTPFNYGTGETTNETNKESVNSDFTKTNKIIEVQQDVIEFDFNYNISDMSRVKDNRLIDISDNNISQMNRHSQANHLALFKIIDITGTTPVEMDDASNSNFDKKNKIIDIVGTTGTLPFEFLNTATHLGRKVIEIMPSAPTQAENHINLNYLNKKYVADIFGTTPIQLKQITAQYLIDNGITPNNITFEAYKDEVLDNSITIGTTPQSQKVIDFTSQTEAEAPKSINSTPQSQKVIDFMGQTEAEAPKAINSTPQSQKVIDYVDNTEAIAPDSINANTSLSNKIIELQQSPYPSVMNESMNVNYATTRLIDYVEGDADTSLIDQHELIDSRGDKHPYYLHKLSNHNEGPRIIEQTGLTPCVIQIRAEGGVNRPDDTSVNFDKKNTKILSSLNNEKFVPILQSDEMIRENTIPFTTTENQRVFAVKNSGLVDVYREGFLLSPGDYQNNGLQIVLNDPCNIGETVIIKTKVKFAHSNSITMDDLHNELKRNSTTVPILTYKSDVYEGEPIIITIQNWDSRLNYNVKVRFTGKTENEKLLWKQQQNQIIVESPQIEGKDYSSIQVSITASEEGKFTSTPQTSNVLVKNTFDSTTESISHTMIVGDTPKTLLGKQLIQMPFNDKINSERSTNYTVKNYDDNGTERFYVDMIKDAIVQSKVLNGSISGEKFKGRTIEASLGLRDVNYHRITPSTKSYSQTKLSLSEFKDNNPNKLVVNSAELLKYHKDGKLWFLMDKDTPKEGEEPLLFGEYQVSKELVQDLIVLPQDDGYIIEHTDRLRNRILKQILVLDFDLAVDFDSEGKTSIPLSNEDGSIKVPIEKFDVIMSKDPLSSGYQSSTDIPVLTMRVNTPEVTSVVNDIFNLNSKFIVKTAEREYTLEFNNVTGSKVFSGLIVDIKDKIQPDPTFPRFPIAVKDTLNTLKDVNLICGYNEDGSPHKKLYLWEQEKIGSQVTKTLTKPNSPLELLANTCISIHNKITPSTVIDVATTLELEYNKDVIGIGGRKDIIFNPGNEELTRSFIQNTIIQNKIKTKLLNADDPLHSETVSGIYTNIEPIEYNHSNFWDIVFKPITRNDKKSELDFVFELIRTEVPVTEEPFRKLCNGFLAFDKLKKDGIQVNIPGLESTLSIGGTTYLPEVTKVKEIGIPDWEAVNSFENDSIYVFMKEVFARRGTPHLSEENPGYKNRDVIAEIGYSIAKNSEDDYQPQLLIRWFRCRSTSNGSGVIHSMTLMETILTRKEQINQRVYLTKTDGMDKAQESNKDTLFSGTNPLQPIFNTSGINIQEMWFDNSDPQNPKTLVTDPKKNQIKFIDAFYRGGANGGEVILLVENTIEKSVKLYKLHWTSAITTPNFELLHVVEDEQNKFDSGTNILGDRWRIIDNNTSNDSDFYLVRTKDDGYTPDETKVGIFEIRKVQDKYKLEQKASTQLQTSGGGTFITVKERLGQEPRIIWLSPETLKHQQINQSGAILYTSSILNELQAVLSKNEFDSFQKEIIDLDAGQQDIKFIKIQPNHKQYQISRVIQDNNQEDSDGVQIKFWKNSTEDGLPKSNAVFQLRTKHKMQVDSVRLSLGDNLFID